MTARSEAAHAGTSDPGSEPKRTRALAAALRSSASSAVETVNGGVALVFVSVRPEDPDSACLRAAAGFGNATEARGAAEVLLPRVREVAATRSMTQFDPIEALGNRSAGGLIIYPLVCGEWVHGTLAVGSPASPDASQLRMIATLASELGLRLDHERLNNALQSAPSPPAEAATIPESDHADEILQLSEALFAQDIELLRSNEKLNKIEKLKSDFIERMSRELRTPVNGIIESIISVLTGENESLSDTAKASLRRALDDGTGFLRTLQNIIDLWRIQRSELPVEVQDVNFRETVDEAIFSLQDDIEGKPLTVEQQLQEPFPKIRTDLTKINQILFLMLDNAVKFTPQGKIEIAARVNDGRLHCEIRDTGVGICTDDQQYIFDEFYQVDEPASDKYRGAGLGLALVRNLIILLEGEIAVRSEVGAGSTFIFSIPVQVVG